MAPTSRNASRTAAAPASARGPDRTTLAARRQSPNPTRPIASTSRGRSSSGSQCWRSQASASSRIASSSAAITVHVSTRAGWLSSRPNVRSGGGVLSRRCAIRSGSCQDLESRSTARCRGRPSGGWGPSRWPPRPLAGSGWPDRGWGCRSRGRSAPGCHGRVSGRESLTRSMSVDSLMRRLGETDLATLPGFDAFGGQAQSVLIEVERPLHIRNVQDDVVQRTNARTGSLPHAC